MSVHETLLSTPRPPPLPPAQVYMLLWVPWPLFQPEVVNYAVGLDLLDTQHEAVFIGTKNGADMLVSNQQQQQ